MKRLPIVYAKDLSGKEYWRSLGEHEKSPEFQEYLEQEFWPGASEFPEETQTSEPSVSRRGFLSIMGASVALASFAACRRPEEKIVPYTKRPEDLIPGNSMYFATAIAWAGTAVGLLVESHEGRPTKIEGNPNHPESLGATNAHLQAMVLDLYDPDRSQSSQEKKQPKTLAETQNMLRSVGAKLKSTQGKGFAVLCESHRSPTLAAKLDELKSAFPLAKIVYYDPLSRQHIRDGAKLAFGLSLEPIYELAKAKTILSLDADLFGNEACFIKNARSFVNGRRPVTHMTLQPSSQKNHHAKEEHKDHAVVEPHSNASLLDLNRLYVVESTFTITGSMADHRLRVPSRSVEGFLFELVRELATAHGVNFGSEITAALNGQTRELPEKAKKWVKVLAKELVHHREHSLIAVGMQHKPAVHALAHALNVALGNEGKTVSYVQSFLQDSDGPQNIVELAKSIRSKEIDSLLVLGGNPAFNAPFDADFANAMTQLSMSIHLATHFDETSERSTWHVNRAHFLESWGDVRALDGTLSIVQPLIAPMFDGMTDHEVVQLLLGHTQKSYDIVQEVWKKAFIQTDFNKKWRRSLHDGLVQASAFSVEKVNVKFSEIGTAVRSIPLPTKGIEVCFYPDVHVWDGRFANNGWLQEFPDPITKSTWGNAAWLSPKTAKEHNLKDGDIVAIGIPQGQSIQIPVILVPGQADGSVAVHVGQGRSVVGRVGKGIGINTFPLRTSSGFYTASEISMTKSGQKQELVRTQEHFVMEGRPIVREGSVQQYTKDPAFAQKMVEHPELLSLWHEHKYEGHKWGMTIDLNSCIGCGACMVACQAENNIPVVGVEAVKRSREMHWIRVDRYFEGDPDGDVRSVTQPMPCQQCENAPCEQVCPVGATAHSPEGLNDMAYNRCIGTRYCLNNCPYKVRRFNFFDYAKEGHSIRKLQYNPNVSVRTRGVVEKCTFCVQRINEAKIATKVEGHDRVKDGQIVTACQQVCPTQAIVFGDLNDPNSQVVKHATHSLAYNVLAELNVKPRVSYLAKVRNLNPELEAV